ncbi:MAG TPA: UDP-3-O-acyl-N-acetylglucosamine deacetylase [Phycisphaerae bacterium]|nr:UDP-3-O-acyl-N-acetylglucosamine deacetylase [Phycisphaerae bacterium]
MKPQQTIRRTVELEGRGLFTGLPVTVRLHPGRPNTGLWFVRSDQPTPVRVPARVELVSKRARRTSLQNGTVSIETVEHCLSACAGLGIDNLEIELTNTELPVLDGSCLPLVELIQEAGIETQEARRDPYVIREMTRVVDGEMELVALPPLSADAETLDIIYELDYGPDSPIGQQVFAFSCRPDRFVQQIAPARTFALEAEAEALRNSGLGQHLTYRDVVIYGKDGPIDNPLRFPDECVRHKVLDLLGDLMLLGRFIVGRIHARKSGHALNHALVRALRESEQRMLSTAQALKAPKLDIHRVQRILPHRYPFLMVDRIIEIEGTQRAVGIKNVTINEEFFQGHYPGQPIMPGVLIIEAMAQLGGILLSQNLEHTGKVAVLFSLDKVKFRRSVTPGDQLIMEVETVRARANLGHVRTVARVGTEIAAQAEIKFMLTDAHED